MQTNNIKQIVSEHTKATNYITIAMIGEMLILAGTLFYTRNLPLKNKIDPGSIIILAATTALFVVISHFWLWHRTKKTSQLKKLTRKLNKNLTAEDLQVSKSTFSILSDNEKIMAEALLKIKGRATTLTVLTGIPTPFGFIYSFMHKEYSIFILTMFLGILLIIYNKKSYQKATKLFTDLKEHNEIETIDNKRPLSISILCIFSALGFGLAMLPILLTGSNSPIIFYFAQFPIWLSTLSIMTLTAATISLVGLWKMELWGGHLYIFSTLAGGCLQIYIQTLNLPHVNQNIWSFAYNVIFMYCVYSSLNKMKAT